jgi:hypothetical protein
MTKEMASEAFMSPVTALPGVSYQEEYKKLTSVPDQPAPKAAPVPDELRRKRSKERSMQRKYAKAGRAGTVLSSDSDKLG